MVMELVTLCGVFTIDGGTLYLWSLEFHEQQCGGQVGLSKEGSEEAEVVCGRPSSPHPAQGGVAQHRASAG